jgi:hypothetical protein
MKTRCWDVVCIQDYSIIHILRICERLSLAPCLVGQIQQQFSGVYSVLIAAHYSVCCFGAAIDC